MKAPDWLVMTKGARYAMVFLFVLTFALSAASYHLSVSAAQGAVASRASVVQLCRAGNEARAQQVTLWTHIIAISVPTAHQTPAQQRARRALIASFLRYVRHVFAPRDCTAKFGQ